MIEKLEDLEFADDLVLLSQKISHVWQKFEALQEQAVRVGLKVNASKTKEMRIRAPPNVGDNKCEGLGTTYCLYIPRQYCYHN